MPPASMAWGMAIAPMSPPSRMCEHVSYICSNSHTLYCEKKIPPPSPTLKRPLERPASRVSAVHRCYTAQKTNFGTNGGGADASPHRAPTWWPLDFAGVCPPVAEPAQTPMLMLPLSLNPDSLCSLLLFLTCISHLPYDIYDPSSAPD